MELHSPPAMKMWNYFYCPDHNLMESIHPSEFEKPLISVYNIYYVIYVINNIYNINYKMRKMKAIENESFPDINPNLGELFRG